MSLPRLVQGSFESLNIAPPTWEGRHMTHAMGLVNPERPAQEGFRLLDEFPGIEQCQNNWCYAAIAACVNKYMIAVRQSGPTATRMRQGDIADAQFPGKGCGGPRSKTTCNDWGYVDKALETVGQKPRKVCRGGPGFDLCVKEIKAGRPLPVRIKRRGGGMHFVAIYGVGPGLHVSIWDPSRGWFEFHMDKWRESAGEIQHYYLLPEQPGQGG